MDIQRTEDFALTPSFLEEVWQQTIKDYYLSGGGTLEVLNTYEVETMVQTLAKHLAQKSQEQPGFITPFLYRVDLSEHTSPTFFSSSSATQQWAQTAVQVLNREAIKCWTRKKYKM